MRQDDNTLGLAGRSSSSRLVELDALKWFAMLWVVLGHLIDPGTSGSATFRGLFLFAYSWHMPVFIFLSGLFDKGDRAPWGRAAFFLIVGFVFKIANLLVAILTGSSPSFALLSDAGAPWFMFALAAWVVLAWATRNVPTVPLLAFFVVLSLAIGYDKQIGDWLYLSRVITLFPFYLAGCRLTASDVLDRVRRPQYALLGVAGLMLLLAVCLVLEQHVYFIRPMFTWRNPYSVLGDMAVFGPLFRLVAYCVSIGAIAALLSVFSYVRCGWMSRFGARTLGIYFWHVPIIAVLCKTGFYAMLLRGGAFEKLILLGIGVALTLVLSHPAFS
ncbi:MAG: acyltransferase family protein, partial [Eggerthellaceae bacterium]|nr:acyltransferase family protein [Eggerthellaceae bacterium]